MLLTVCHAELFRSHAPTRLPFRFGATTLKGGTTLTARVRVRTPDGDEAEGHAADLLVPRWFDKDPAKSPERNVEDLVAAAVDAGRAFRARARPSTPFDLWWSVYRERVAPLPDSDARRMVRGFGIALIERAVLDAACRLLELPFGAAVREDRLGFRPGRVHPELEGEDPAAWLPAAPAGTVAVRHTVGMADPLRVADVPPEKRLDDGFPQALEEDVAAYGLRFFKLKIGAGPAADAERLHAIARVLGESVSGTWQCTLDGNEQYDDLADLVGLFGRLRVHAEGRELLEALLYVEQPLPRSATFDPARNAAIDEVSATAPVILDEADSAVESFPRAVALGYRGISVKNCKGVFRALLNAGLCARSGGALFQSAEDLTNLAVLPLQQDLATVAVLGLAHAERNGHHYFRGLDHLPAPEVEEALARHPDLYRPQPGGGGALRIENGRLRIESLQCPGYGHAVGVRTDLRHPVPP